MQFNNIFDVQVYVRVMEVFPVFSSIVFGWIGCCIGSFLNVCIYRVPRGMSLMYPPSHCPKCNHKLAPYENIPIFAWLFLGGKCKKCRQPISPRYIIIEALTGLIFAALFWRVYLTTGMPFRDLWLLCYVSSLILVTAFTDCDLRIVPDLFTYPAMVLILLFWSFHSGRFNFGTMLMPLISMICAGAYLFFFSWLGKKIWKRDVFGLGDVKYMICCAGAFGLTPALLILLLACILATVYMPVYWHFRPKRRKRGFAFVPFLTISAFIWIFTEPIFANFLNSIHIR